MARRVPESPELAPASRSFGCVHHIARGKVIRGLVGRYGRRHVLEATTLRQVECIFRLVRGRDLTDPAVVRKHRLEREFARGPWRARESRVDLRRDRGRVDIPVVVPHLELVRPEHLKAPQDVVQQDRRKRRCVAVLRMDIACGIRSPEHQRHFVQHVVHVERLSVVPLTEGEGVRYRGLRGSTCGDCLESLSRRVPHLGVGGNRDAGGWTGCIHGILGPNGHVQPRVRMWPDRGIGEGVRLKHIVQPSEALPRIPW